MNLPRAGEDTTPQIRLEQPWPQWLLVFTVLGSVVLILWLYRREGKASTAAKLMLASLRITLVLLAMFMLYEAVLSVARTGLPYLTILIDDSASERITDQYEKPEVKTALDALAGSGPDDATGPRQGPDSEGQRQVVRELEKEHKVRFYVVSNATRLLAEVDRPTDLEPAIAKLRAIEAIGGQSRLGDGVRRVLTELRGAPPSAIVLFSDGQTTDGEPLSKGGGAGRAKRCSALYDRAGERRARPRHRADRAPSR